MPMNLTVRVLHNVSRDMFFGYHPKTSRLYHAHTFQVSADNVEQAVNLVWVLTNIDDANALARRHPHLSQYGTQVTAYRARRNRSLSVADVLVVHEGARPAGVLAIVSVGHERLEAIPDYADGTNASPYSVAYQAHVAFRNKV
jgi:hypothetical protein